jgi:hypothetical protein
VCLLQRHLCTLLLVYVDDTGPVKIEVDEAICLVKTTFQLGEEGNLCNYLGIKVTKLPDGMITLTQQHLSHSILTDLNVQSVITIGRNTPALAIKHIGRYLLSTK